MVKSEEERTETTAELKLGKEKTVTVEKKDEKGGLERFDLNNGKQEKKETEKQTKVTDSELGSSWFGKEKEEFTQTSEKEDSFEQEKMTGKENK